MAARSSSACPLAAARAAAELTGTFPAVLAFSILLAALCLSSLGRVARVVTAARPEAGQ